MTERRKDGKTEGRKDGRTERQKGKRAKGQKSKRAKGQKGRRKDVTENKETVKKKKLGEGRKKRERMVGMMKEGKSTKG
jgi:hypothetical protein